MTSAGSRGEMAMYGKERDVGKWSSKYWLSSLSVPHIVRLSWVYYWTDYHVSAHRRLQLYTTRLAPSRPANFPRINKSHSSIYGDHVGIADAPLGAPYKVRVSVGLLLPCHGDNCFYFRRTFSFLLIIFRNRVQDPRKKAHTYRCDGPERYWVAEEDHA
jgi:hypothetical protein